MEQQTVATATALPVCEKDVVLNNTIAGTNLAPGTVANDDCTDNPLAYRAYDKALVEADTNNTPMYNVDDINRCDRETLRGRTLHVGDGVWVRFCSHANCDAYVLNYGYQLYISAMAHHEVDHVQQL